MNFLVKSRLRWLVICNRGLIFISAGLMVYAAVAFALPKRRPPSGITQKEFSQTSEGVSPKIILPEAKPFDNYADVIRSRDIFSIAQPGGKSLAENPNNIPQASFATTQDWIKNLKLVGILMDREPQAVIEDLQKNETVFLSHGQQLDEAVLEEIQEGKVIFLYQGHRIELTF